MATTGVTFICGRRPTAYGRVRPAALWWPAFPAAEPVAIDEKAAEVIAAYAPYIALRVGASQEGWVRLEGEHPEPAVP